MTQAQELRVLPGGRTPPQNIDAEKSVLGAVLIKPAAVEELQGVLQTDDFYLPAHREVFEAIIALAGRRAVLDPIAIADELKHRGGLSRLEGGELYLMELASSVPTAENIATYVRIVREKAALRRMLSKLVELQSEIYGEVESPQGILDHARAEIDRIASSLDSHEPVKIGQDIPAVMDAIERRGQSPEETPVQYGLERLDLLLGGLHPENVIVVAARPGMGKSAFVTTAMANNSKRGIPCLLFSLEMSRHEVVERILAGASAINSRALRSGAITAHDGGRLFEAASRVGELPMWIDGRSGLTMSQMAGTARRWYSRFLGPVPPDDQPAKPALIAIDYLQIMGTDREDRRKGEGRAEEIGRITGAIKQLAKALRVPILEISQLNRELEKHQRPPVLADLRESGSIEQDADIVLFPWRELPADPHEAEREKRISGPAQIRCEKNRHGSTGIANVHWVAEYTRFENSTESLPHWQDR